MTETNSTAVRSPAETDRKRWMAVLARATRAELEGVIGAALPANGARLGFARLKGPETGTIMIEGRAGGGGRRFNLGEATVTRAVVRLSCGTLGFSYALGTDHRKAELAALLDGVLQKSDETAAGVLAHVDALARSQDQRREDRSRKAAATKVDFFTVTRGHD
jgi:alpha-D-ribose 1-methylphosphonate 5-triphosphate synthase subunit PhnG